MQAASACALRSLISDLLLKRQDKKEDHDIHIIIKRMSSRHGNESRTLFLMLLGCGLHSQVFRIVQQWIQSGKLTIGYRCTSDECFRFDWPKPRDFDVHAGGLCPPRPAATEVAP